MIEIQDSERGRSASQPGRHSCMEDKLRCARDWIKARRLEEGVGLRKRQDG